MPKDNNSIRISTYNMMFGMYGKNILYQALGHFAFHGIHSKFLTNSLSNFNRKTVRVIVKNKKSWV